MATFPQVLRTKSQGRRQHWFIHGNEPAVVQDAYELAQTHVYSANVDVLRQTFFGGEVTPDELEVALMQDMEQDRQLVVLLEAEKFTQWDRLALVLKSAGTERFFVAVAKDEPDQDVQKLFLNSTKARYIVCNELSPEDQKTWVSTRVKITADAADFLVRRARGDHDWLLNQMRKLARLPMTKVDLPMAKKLCPSQGIPDFALALLTQNKRGALDALMVQVPSPDHLNRLVRTLGRFLAVNEGVRHAGTSNRLLLERTEMTQKEISVFRDPALYYDRNVSTKCYASLIRLHEGLARSSRHAYLSLITRW